MDVPIADPIVLVIEHNPDHLALIQRALGESAVHPHVEAIAQGAAALDFLHQRGQYRDAPRPHLILLDFNLPDMDGAALLQDLKSTPQLKRIPVIILTTSSNTDEILQTYTNQGNCYVVKASDREELLQLIKRLEEFWLGIVTLPQE